MTASIGISGARWSLFFSVLLLFIIFRRFFFSHTQSLLVLASHIFHFLLFNRRLHFYLLFKYSVVVDSNTHSPGLHGRWTKNKPQLRISRLNSLNSRWKQMEHFLNVFLLSFCSVGSGFRCVPVHRPRARHTQIRNSRNVECKRRRTAMCNSLHSSQMRNVRFLFLFFFFEKSTQTLAVPSLSLPP